MDTQALQVIKGTHTGPNVRKVARLLENLDAGTDSVIFGAQRWAVSDLPNMPVGNLPSEGFRVSFYGGPPGSVTWREGSIRTMLEDRLLYMTVYLGKAAVLRRCPDVKEILSEKGLEVWYA